MENTKLIKEVHYFDSEIENKKKINIKKDMKQILTFLKTNKRCMKITYPDVETAGKRFHSLYAGCEWRKLNVLVRQNSCDVYICKKDDVESKYTVEYNVQWNGTWSNGIIREDLKKLRNFIDDSNRNIMKIEYSSNEEAKKRRKAFWVNYSEKCKFLIDDTTMTIVKKRK